MQEKSWKEIKSTPQHADSSIQSLQSSKNSLYLLESKICHNIFKEIISGNATKFRIAAALLFSLNTE